MSLKTAPMKSLIMLSVGAVHLLFVCFLIFSSPLSVQKKQRHPIRVKTLISVAPTIAEKKTLPSKPATQKMTPVASNATPVPRAPTPKKTAEKTTPVAATAIPQPKKTEKLQPTQKELTVKKNPQGNKQAAVKTPVPSSVPKSSSPQIPASLLKELENSIAKLDSKQETKATVKRTPAFSVTPLQIDAKEIVYRQTSQEEGDYIVELTHRLHDSLHLPELGEVKIELTLRQDGTVARLMVLKAESDKNRKYLEEHLHKLRFPALKGSYAKQNECAFVLNFCNEL